MEAVPVQIGTPPGGGKPVLRLVSVWELATWLPPPPLPYLGEEVEAGVGECGAVSPPPPSPLPPSPLAAVAALWRPPPPPLPQL